MHRDFIADYEALFRHSNGSFVCKNEDIAKFQKFTEDWSELFLERGLLVAPMTLQVVGQGQIDIVKENHTKVVKLFGAAFQVYLFACSRLDRQPCQEYQSTVTFVKYDAAQ